MEAWAIGVVVAQSVEDIEKIDEAIDTSTVTGWEIAAALVIAVLAWPVSAIVSRIAKRIARRVPGTPEYIPDLVGRSARAIVVVIAVAWSMSLLGVDVGWFALVIALIAVVVFLMIRPLIENLAAGLLLQSRPSFGVGDEISTNGYVGDVIAITARSTVIQTRDWMRIHIPNQDVLDHAIEVYTAFDRRRSEIDLGVDYAVDPDDAARILEEAVSRVEGVLADPRPQVRARGFGDGVTILRLRWWHGADLASEGATRDRVVREIRRAFEAAGVDMPSPEVKLAGRAQVEILDDDVS